MSAMLDHHRKWARRWERFARFNMALLVINVVAFIGAIVINDGLAAWISVAGTAIAKAAWLFARWHVRKAWIAYEDALPKLSLADVKLYATGLVKRDVN